MSRRDDRDSNFRKYRSKLDREPSPKRYRRDGKLEADKVVNNPDLDSDRHTDRDQKHHRRLRDNLPLDAPLAAPDSKFESAVVGKQSHDKNSDKLEESHMKINELKEFERKTSDSLDPTGVSRSNSYCQYDERGSAGKAGRSYSDRATNERGWRRDSKDGHDDRTVNRTGTNGTRQRDDRSQGRRNDRSQGRRDDNNVWRHDGFFQMEAAPPPPPLTRKRPAFSETKIRTETENAEKSASETGKHFRPDKPMLGGSERSEERGHHLNRPERPFFLDRRASSREEVGRSGRLMKEGYGVGKERFGGRQTNYRPGGRADKWKHDLFDEANKSPTRENEDDQIAKVEALLSS